MQWRRPHLENPGLDEEAAWESRMDVWTKILSRLEDQSLLLLGLVVVLVVWSCFRLLSDGLRLIAGAYTEAEKQKTQAMLAMAEEIKRGNEICHLHTGHMQQILRNQDLARRD